MTSQCWLNCKTGFVCHFLLKQRKTEAKEISLPSFLPLETIHHLMEDKPWQFCQNSNQQIACCSACPRRSATVDDKQSDGHSLNYRGKGRASNDPGPISDCTGCLVSSSQRHQGFFSPTCSFLYFAAGRNADSEGRPKCLRPSPGTGLTKPTPATGINAYIITLLHCH